MKSIKRFVILAAGCAAIPFTGHCFFTDYSAPVGRPVQNLNSPEDSYAVLQPSETFVGLACSGGGSRAAYFTAAILREIQRSCPSNELAQGGLLAQINAVSSVSGGSLAAADFVLNHHALTTSPADSKTWQEFSDKMALPYRTREWWWHGRCGR